MTSKVPFKISEINIDNICYTDIKTRNNKTIIYLKYMDTNKLRNIVFQTPTLLNINDVISSKSKNLLQDSIVSETMSYTNKIYELDIPLTGKSDTKTNKFIKFLQAIDNKIIKDARNNTKWFDAFPQQKTMRYQKLIRESDNTMYENGMIRVKIIRSNDFDTVINYNNNRINPTDISKNCWIKSILEIYAIWINEHGFGLFVRPILIDLKTIQKSSYNYNLIDESDEVEDVDDMVCTVQDFSNNSIFIKSENEITSSVLEMPNNSDEEINSESSETECGNNINIPSTTSE